MDGLPHSAYRCRINFADRTEQDNGEPLKPAAWRYRAILGLVLVTGKRVPLALVLEWHNRGCDPSMISHHSSLEHACTMSKLTSPSRTMGGLSHQTRCTAQALRQRTSALPTAPCALPCLQCRAVPISARTAKPLRNVIFQSPNRTNKGRGVVNALRRVRLRQLASCSHCSCRGHTLPRPRNRLGVHIK